MPRTTRIVVKVPEDMKGRIIGKKGQELRRIEKESGAKVKIEREGAVVEGSEKAVAKAKEIIDAIIVSTRFCQ